jgi:hypothetical protein
MPSFADAGVPRGVNVTDPYGRILVFLDRSRYCFFQVAPQMYHEAEWTLMCGFQRFGNYSRDQRSAPLS